MAVYFQREYRPWWTDLANTALSGLVRGMFERDAAARAKNGFNRQWGQLQDSLGNFANDVPASSGAGLSVRSAPEVERLSELFEPARGTEVPTGLSGPVRNGYVAPSREMAYGNLGRLMAPENVEAARKLLGDQWGREFELQDGDRLSSRMGPLPRYDDRQGTLEYVDRLGAYDPRRAATMSGFIQSLNPGFRNSAVDLGNRRVVLSQDPYTGRTAPVFSGAVGVSPNRVYHNARADFRAQGGAGTGIRKMAEPYVRAIVNAQKQAGAGQVPEMGPEDFDRLVNTINYECGEYAPAVLDYIGSLPALLSPGEGDNADDFGPVATRANPFRGPYERYVGTSRRIHLPAHEGEVGKVSPAAPEGPGETLRQRQVRELVALTGKSPEEVERYLAEKNRAAPQRPAPKPEVKKPPAPVRSFADEVADVQRKRRNWTPW